MKKKTATSSSSSISPNDLGNELYRELAEQAGEGIFTADLKGNIIYANKVAHQILHLNGSSTPNVRVTKYLSKESFQQIKKNLRRVMNGEKVIRDEILIKSLKGPERLIEFTATPIKIKSKVAQIQAIIRDVSKRRELENLVKETDKMKIIQNFIVGSAQEIRNPLKCSYDHIQNLMTNYQDRDFEYIGFKEYQEIFDTLEKLKDQIKYCHDTNERLLFLNKQKFGIQNEYCNPNEIIQELITTYRDDFKMSEITCQVKLSKQVPPVAIDQIELKQVLENILINAAQSIHTNGIIKLQTSFLTKKKMVSIKCMDNGVGISKDTLSHVYEPFFTTKQRGLEKNSGLGLTIAQSIIQKHHGEIHISSNLRSGTQVTILLPAVQPHE